MTCVIPTFLGTEAGVATPKEGADCGVEKGVALGVESAEDFSTISIAYRHASKAGKIEFERTNRKKMPVYVVDQ